tara:strand:- start:3312 stop:4331 length:1020 start_codon:yes stop_codon:yes gene_type:complete
MFLPEIITKEYILSKVSEYQIFKYYCKNFVENKLFSSELRQDSSPSCKIYNNNGRLLYVDYGSGEKYDCFEYIKVKHRSLYKEDLNFYEVLNIIASDFNIIRKTKDNKITPSLNYIGRADTFKGIKTRYSLKKKRRDWNKADTYWKDYYFTQDLLDFYNVEPLENYWKSGSNEVYNLTYSYKDNIFDPAYSYEEINGYRKILRPYNDKQKWDSNMPRQIVEGYTQLEQTGDYCIITSSRKDTMAWRLFGYNACNPGSETVFLTQNCFLLLKNRFKHIIINYDNDTQGLFSMNKYAQEFGIKQFIIPKLSPSVKDLSDLLYFKGWDTTQKIINNFKNNLI